MKSTTKRTLPFYVASVFSIATLFVLAFGLNIQINAQTPAELATGSYANSSNGPTIVPQPARLLLNSSGTTYAAPKTNVTVTASVSNQQYVGSNTGTGSPVLLMGGRNNSGASSPMPRPVYTMMTEVGSPANSMYSNRNDGAAQGIDVASNLAFTMYTSIQHWRGSATPAPSNRTYMADLTLSFSTPLTNPLLQIVGLGGTTGSLGFTSELDLVTPGLTLSKVQGNTALSVTATKINNANSSGIGADCSASLAGCGTVRLNGSNIQSVTFKVYVRGDGDYSGNWGGSATTHSGDLWLIGLSVPETFSVSGKVFYDSNGMGDSTVNGNGISIAAGTQLYANMIEPVSGKVIGSVPVNSDGTYSFDGVPAGANARVEISASQGTELSSAPARNLPNNWTYNGENIGTGTGGENSPDGALAFTVNGNMTNVNFGVANVGPTAASVTISGRVMTYKGAGIRNVLITLTDTGGFRRTAITGSFGYYRFEGVAAGETYVISAQGKRYRFSQPSQALNLYEDTSDINFFGY